MRKKVGLRKKVGVKIRRLFVSPVGSPVERTVERTVVERPCLLPPLPLFLLPLFLLPLLSCVPVRVAVRAGAFAKEFRN